jgi:hypothetical protein
MELKLVIFASRCIGGRSGPGRWNISRFSEMTSLGAQERIARNSISAATVSLPTPETERLRDTNALH